MRTAKEQAVAPATDVPSVRSGLVNAREGARLGLVLAVGILVRIPFLAYDPVITSDLRTFRSWSSGIHERGLLRAYEDRSIDYPPLSIALLGLAGAAPGAHLTAAVKAISLAADLVLASVVASAWRRRAGGSGAGAAAAILFHPGIWYVSAWWGQLDALYTLFLLVAVLALDRGRSARGGLAAAAALGTKLQAVAVAPVLAALAWRGGVRTSLQTLAAGAGGALLLAAPWLLTGRGHDLARVLTELPSEPPRVTVSGYNLWYLLFAGRVSGVTSQGGRQALGVILFGLLAAVVTLLTLRNGRAPLAAACLALGFFVLATQVHERYLFPAFPFLLVAAAEENGPARAAFHAIFATLSVTWTLNLVTIATPAAWLGINLVAAPDSPRTALLRASALAAAVVHAAALGALTSFLARRRLLR